MDHWLFLDLLAQTSRALPLREPFLSADAIWWIGAVLFGLWLLAVGASVGSFLNVVVYRVPAGLNLLSPGSRCPRCLHPIRIQHNIPILGWLMLRGRCADCQLPISTRYPLVELLMATIFLVVGSVELIGNAVNLPRPAAELGLQRPALSTNEPLALGGAATLHLALISTLIAAALIDYDGQPIPQRIVLPVIVFAIIVALAKPAIHPLPALELRFTEWGPTSASRLQSPLLDVIVGGFAGVLAAAVCKAAVRSRPWLERRYGGAVYLLWIAIGLVFGWQLVPWILACWAVHYWLSIAPGRDPAVHPLLPAAGLAVAVLVTLLFWRIVAGYPRVLDQTLVAQAVIYGVTTGAAWVLLLAAAGRLPADFVFPPPQVAPDFLPASEPSLPADEPSES
jgi:leader peptidase (prepilin peptidase)/N-methyltransferase